ncbi:MAG TPA: hypothetical protein PKM43_07755, partial [Verrucomicrobiota bacterium]|nr:hypothetical protein [Verrucomicrobiota bacterium]
HTMDKRRGWGGGCRGSVVLGLGSSRQGFPEVAIGQAPGEIGDGRSEMGARADDGGFAQDAGKLNGSVRSIAVQGVGRPGPKERQ